MVNLFPVVFHCSSFVLSPEIEIFRNNPYPSARPTVVCPLINVCPVLLKCKCSEDKRATLVI